MHDATPSDRVQLVGQSELVHPGCCALCGTGNSDDGYVNTGIWYDYEGQVYFCWTCAHQIAAVLGCLSADEVAHVQSLLSDTAVELASVKAELELANARVRQYDDLLAGIANARPDRPSDASSDLTENVSEEPPAEPVVSDKPVAAANEGKPVVKKSVASSGRRKPARPERSDSSTSDGFNL